MAQYGSNSGMFAQSVVQTVDSQGNPVTSADTSFGASPAGSALLTQQLFGLPNASFDLIPPDPLSPLGNNNQVPYWDWANYSDGVIAGSAVYNSTTNNWGVTIYPGTAAVDSYATFTTRSFLINDDNLGLRQKVFAVLEKSGTAAGTTQVNLTLSATYYDSTDTALSTAIIGTALDTGTWTSLSGFTTTGGSAISASAHYVDIQFKVTATANITGSVNFGIKSCLLTSKIAAVGTFQIIDFYSSSGTWTVPSGVTAVSVVAMGCGGGGGSGGAYRETGTATVNGGGGGGAGGLVIVQNLPVTAGSAITIGIGSGGSGGGGVNANGPVTGNAGSAGATGSSTTFGSFITAAGGVGGQGGGFLAGTAGSASGFAGGAGGSATSTAVGAALYSGNTGGNGTRWSTSLQLAQAGTAQFSGATSMPLFTGTAPSAGLIGGTAVLSTTTSTFRGTPGSAGAAGWGGSGGGGGGFVTGGTVTMLDGGAGGAAGGGGGGAGWYKTTGQAVGTAGAGGNAGANSCAGGGGGGAVNSSSTTGNRSEFVSGAGGSGGSGGFVAIGYIA